jgi:hypothetical protein
MTPRANRRRGEIEAMIDGKRRILCLTLGALAELETAFGVDNIMDLASAFSKGRIGAKGMIAVLGAGLRGGGNVMDDEDVATMYIDGGVEGAVRLTAQLLSSAFLDVSNKGAGRSSNPPLPQPA